MLVRVQGNINMHIKRSYRSLLILYYVFYDWMSSKSVQIASCKKSTQQTSISGKDMQCGYLFFLLLFLKWDYKTKHLYKFRIGRIQNILIQYRPKQRFVTSYELFNEQCLYYAFNMLFCTVKIVSIVKSGMRNTVCE